MIMPLMSAGFTFMFSAGIGVYWIASNVFQIIQQQITFHYFKSREDETVVINTIKPNRKDSKKHR
jgi:YidC/Oxa1 family membrane protein insertase